MSSSPTLRQKLTDVMDARESTIRFIDGHDDALLGMVEDEYEPYYHAVYSCERILGQLRMDGMTEGEAFEFFEHNIRGSKFSGSSPIYVETWNC